MKSLILAVALMLLTVPVHAGSWLWDGNPPNRSMAEPPGNWLWDGNPPNRSLDDPPGTWLWNRYEYQTPNGPVPKRRESGRWY